MLIENPECLRTWLTSMLQPLCDADPAALAKYVLALIKKDKPETELRKSMIDQLDVFLQQETTGFVDLLFVTLANKSYLSEAAAATSANDVDIKPASPVDVGAVVNENNNDSAGNSVEGMESATTTSKSPGTGVESSLPVKVEKGAVNIKKEPNKKDDEKDRENRAHRRSRSPRRSPPRGHDRRQRSRSPRDRDRDLYRGRHRGRKSPPRGRYDRRDDQWDRRRSDRRSPARNRSASPRPRTRSPRYRRYHSRSRSRSPVVRDRSPNREKAEKTEVTTPTTESEAMEVSEPKSQLQSVVRAVNTPEKGEGYTGTTPGTNKRCRDFDEKGLCMRGELCEFDHGTDPVVLEDISVSPRTTPSDYMGGPGNAYAPQMLRPSMPMLGGPGMDPMCWGPGMPPPFRPRHMGGMRHRMPLPRPPMGFPMMPARELISVPVTSEGSADPSMMEMHPMGPPMHMGMSMPPRMRGGIHQGRGRGRGGFDHARLGMKPARNYANTSLEVKKIPRELNNIMDLNSHFLRFGKIVNIQINFENDPEAALITFASPTEANLAYRSTEAVLNNRFIRVFWHNKEKENEEGMELGNPELGGSSMGKDRLGFAEGGEDMMEHEKILVSGNNLTKTVYNPGLLAKKAEEKVLAVEAIKKSQEALSQLEHQKKVKEESQRNARKLMVDLRKRKQDMLHQQIEQQKKLISKLEHCKNKPEKDGLMSLIKSLQESIESIKKELDESARTQIGVAVQPIIKPKEEPVLSQKDLLDAELDLIQREQEGGDTNALQKKILELRAQAHTRGGMRGRGSTPFRGSTRGTFLASRGRGNGKRFRLLRKVDRRPTTICVTGFSGDRLKDILKHFSNFGPIAYYDANPVIPSLTLTFESRKKAEIAFANGKKFEDSNLNLDWVQTSSSGNDKGNSDAINNGQPISHDDENNVSMEEEDMSDVYADELLFQYDDEEEEDDERSWRR